IVWIGARTMISIKVTRSRRGRQPRHTRARADDLRGACVLLLRFAKDLARFFTGGAAGIADGLAGRAGRALRLFARTPRALAYIVRALAHLKLFTKSLSLCARTLCLARHAR